MARLLVVEDDSSIGENLCLFLKNEGFDVDFAPDCTKALQKIETQKYDLILADISLPDGSGYSVCSAAKKLSSAAVIFLTAWDDEYSVVTGLDMGADDYISKPFRPRELVSRIKSVLRRSGNDNKFIEYEGVRLDCAKANVTKNGEEIFLSALEYKLLLVLFSNMGVVLTREKLMDEIWSLSGEYVTDNTLTVYIKRLREKIEDDPQNPKVIKTVRGLGYKAGD